jgi:hypothetical protein
LKRLALLVEKNRFNRKNGLHYIILYFHYPGLFLGGDAGAKEVIRAAVAWAVWIKLA